MHDPNGDTVVEILARRRDRGPVEVYSACTASEVAIRACLERSKRTGGYVLVEATANQVDQTGGFTGMRPVNFARFVPELADRQALPRDRVILGGDHLGPLTWRELPSKHAMEQAAELVRLFVLAGFTKIHLDTSMCLGDDKCSRGLPAETVASRAVMLARVAEEAHRTLCSRHPGAPDLVYVVGSEVPIPGGGVGDEDVRVTTPAGLVESVETYRSAFVSAGLSDAWSRTVAIVVQPGVEFSDRGVHEYDRRAAAELVATLGRWPGLVFEGHSTDYQRAASLRALVEGGVAILKVGPALTFAEREGLVALEAIEGELLYRRSGERSHFSEALEQEMLRVPAHWEQHYRGEPDALRLKRRFSYSDRWRYYLPAPPVQQAIDRRFANLASTAIPPSLVSQYLPCQYVRYREGTLSLDHGRWCATAWVTVSTTTSRPRARCARQAALLDARPAWNLHALTAGRHGDPAPAEEKSDGTFRDSVHRPVGRPAVRDHVPETRRLGLRRR
jgi:D-tagatose-1,6-bisphosphate aldolase subunit GatZ/KbaZ